MFKKRNRARLTTTLEQRLAKFTDDLRQQAEALPDGTKEKEDISRRIQQSEAALHMHASLMGRAS